MLAFWLIFAVAVAARAIYFTSLPAALNNDEASIGYDAWSVLNYGVDRNGVWLPVHLIAWGSGQNALYAYLSIPFIALFGLNIFSVRIVNLIFGLVSVAVVYFFVKRFCGVRTAFFAMALTAVSPWHILLSRWGLESNLFPAFFLLGVYVFSLGIDNPKFYAAGAGVLALSLYSYGSSYLVVPLFLLFVCPYIIYKYRPKAKYIIIASLVFAAIATPIFLFVLTNKFGWGDIKIFGFTVPSLTGTSRMSTAVGINSIKNSLNNIFSLLIKQDDGLLYNIVPGYGIVYYISIPFALYGIYVTALRRNLFSVITGVWFAAGFALFFLYSDVNINRVNIIFLPLIIFTAVGISEIFTGFKSITAVAACYAVMFCGFFTFYCTEVKSSLACRDSVYLGDAVVLSEQLADDTQTIYYSDAFWVPYIYVLFYGEIPVEQYLSTVNIEDMTNEMQIVLSFTNHRFYVDELACGEAGVYVLNADEYPAFSEQYGERVTEVYDINNLTVAVLS